VLSEGLEDGAGATVLGVGLQAAEEGGQDRRAGRLDLTRGGPELVGELVDRQGAEDVVESGHEWPSVW